MDMFRHVGAAIRRVRELRGIEQIELARRTGLGKSQISKYENGRDLPKLENLGKIIAALETTPQSFFRVMALLTGLHHHLRCYNAGRNSNNAITYKHDQ